MDAQEKLDQLDWYIRVMTAYYMNVLVDEKDDVKINYIEGKLNMAKDFRKKFNELNDTVTP